MTKPSITAQAFRDLPLDVAINRLERNDYRVTEYENGRYIVSKQWTEKGVRHFAALEELLDGFWVDAGNLEDAGREPLPAEPGVERPVVTILEGNLSMKLYGIHGIVRMLANDSRFDDPNMGDLSCVLMGLRALVDEVYDSMGSVGPDLLDALDGIVEVHQ